MKKLLLEIPELNAKAKVALLNESAQETIKAIENSLPIEGKATHARWGGNEIWIPTPGIENFSIKENPKVEAKPGELLFVNNNGFCDIAIFYGNGWTYDPSGFIIGNHFGTIETADLEDFAKAANSLLINGQKTLKITKIK